MVLFMRQSAAFLTILSVGFVPFAAMGAAPSPERLASALTITLNSARDQSQHHSPSSWTAAVPECGEDSLHPRQVSLAHHLLSAAMARPSLSRSNLSIPLQPALVFTALQVAPKQGPPAAPLHRQ